MAEELRVVKVPSLLTLPDETIARYEAEREEALGMLTPEARARLEQAEREFDKRWIGG